MILVTHAIVGGALGRSVASPTLAFLTGFLSHFLLDAIPHWDYHLRSSRKNKENELNSDIVISRDFYFDLIKIGLDILIGLLVVYYFKLSLWAALGGIIPDFLQFAYFKLRWRLLRWLQAFHIWIHADLRLSDQPILGPALQVLLILAVLAIIRL